MLSFVAEDVVVHQLEVTDAYGVVDVGELPLDADHRLGRWIHVDNIFISITSRTPNRSRSSGRRSGKAIFLLKIEK